MRKFLLKLGYVVTPILLLSIVLDYGISYGLKKDHGALGEYEVWNSIYGASINCDLAIYGSSRAWVQFDPAILEEHLDKQVYNFGTDGHNFRLQYLRHLEYIKYNSKPTYIILSVDIFTLQQREDLYLQDQFLPYMLWNANMYQYTSGYDGFTKADYYIPFVRYAHRSNTIIPAFNHLLDWSSDTITYRNKGFRGFERNWDTELDSLLDGTKKYEIKFDQKTDELLERFIKECQDNGITLTLVYPPEYIKGQEFVVNRRDAIERFETLAHKYELLFLNYSDDVLSFEKQFFYNASHLNKKGSQIFTKKLAKDLKDYY